MPSDLVLEKQPMQMIQVAFEAAIKKGAALEVVDRILEQQKWLIQHSEEEAFNAALKRIQKNLKSVPKKGWNKETHSWFATSEDIDNEIQKLLDQEEMTLSFEPAASANAEEVLIIGTLALGAYSKRYPLPMPADGKGPKGGGVMSRTHATGSAITYGKRYLKNMIFDLRFREHDDDGNAAGNGVDEDIIKDWLNKIGLCESEAELTRVYLDAQKAVENKDTRAALSFAAAKNKRLSELKRGAK